MALGTQPRPAASTSMNAPPHPDVHRIALADCLRVLRTSHWPGRRVTQSELASALGIGNSSVSNWESRTSPMIPAPNRLVDIATFFATRRSLSGAGPHLLRDDLTPDELGERARILGELTALHAVATGTVPAPEAWNPWRFPDHAPVRLVCGSQPDADRITAAQQDDHDFVALNRYADLDAMVDLYGHLRAENPGSDVQHRLVTELTADDLRAHLVVVGNLPRLQDRHGVLGEVELPVRQIPHDGKGGRAFELRNPPHDQVLPTFATVHPHHPLIEDVGFLFRCESAIDRTLTMSFCSGLFTRGAVGAVRTLADPRLRELNASWMLPRFGRSSGYGLLMRVPVHGPHVITPNLTDHRVVLRTFGER
jgi:transcriptional regulator with XRE-family HTH domain